MAAVARASVLAERERPDEQDLNNLIEQDHRAIRGRRRRGWSRKDEWAMALA